MQHVESLKKRIFFLNDEQDRNRLALEIFQFQFTHNPVYQAFATHLGIRPRQVHDPGQIPFLPIEFFKKHRIITTQQSPALAFGSSGTMGQERSFHYLIDPGLYEQSFLTAFRHFYGDPAQYTLFALLPSYLEREDSSLVYMTRELIKRTRKPLSGFYLNNLADLNENLRLASAASERIILLGVSYALLDFALQYPQPPYGMTVMETGGMKGRKEEITRDELHEILCRQLSVTAIHSEYGMTELLSQAYSISSGLFSTPPWMKVLIRDSEDPLHLLGPGKAGGINIIDLANLYSCSFLATQDYGISHNDGTFEVLGRFEASDIRGCNLMLP